MNEWRCPRCGSTGLVAIPDADKLEVRADDSVVLYVRCRIGCARRPEPAKAKD